MQPKIISLPYTYAKKDQGVLVKYLKEIPELTSPEIDPSQTSVVVFTPNGMGGNHAHPRTEVFCCMTSNLTLYWTNESNKTEHLLMERDNSDSLNYYVIPSNLPHAVVNHSSSDGVLIEYADQDQSDVIPHSLIKL